MSFKDYVLTVASLQHMLCFPIP